MGKQELVNPSLGRDKWPTEARVAEKILILCRKLRESNLMEEYLDGKVTDEEVDILLHEHDNSNMIQDIIDLKQECSKLLPEVTCEGRISPRPSYFRALSDLGTILAKSPWWERYQVITASMGVDCVLSIRTAEALFKRDQYSKDIKTQLQWIVKEDML
jgi:hypothetical protein